MPAASHRSNRRQKYSPPDLTFFAAITPESAYWLGFLMADGCVSRSELICVLQRRDEEHLRSFMGVLGCDDRPLAVVNDGNGVRLSIGCAALARQLVAHGIRAGRAYGSEPIAEPLASSADFWRGVVDGDGSIRFDRTHGRPSLTVVGPPRVMEQLADFLAPHLSTTRRPTPHRHSQSDVVRLVSRGGRTAVDAIRVLYAHPMSPALARKRERAERALAWKPQVRSRYPWDRWADGRTHTLARGRDYDDVRRLWEAGRRAARERGLRFSIDDERESEVRIRFSPRVGPPASATATA